MPVTVTVYPTRAAPAGAGLGKCLCIPSALTLTLAMPFYSEEDFERDRVEEEEEEEEGLLAITNKKQMTEGWMNSIGKWFTQKKQKQNTLHRTRRRVLPQNRVLMFFST